MSQSAKIANSCSRLVIRKRCAMGRANFTVRTRWNFNWPLPALAITKHNRICSTVWAVIDKSAICYRIGTPGSICNLGKKVRKPCHSNVNGTCPFIPLRTIQYKHKVIEKGFYMKIIINSRALFHLPPLNLGKTKIMLYA